MTETLSTVKYRLEKLLDGFDAGQAILEGIDTAIVGRPNVGKSSLLDLLSGEEKAIVTDIEGKCNRFYKKILKIRRKIELSSKKWI